MELNTLLRQLPALFCSLLVAILFIQSGLDKAFDWKGNLDWLNGHFSKTPLSRFVWIMLAKITIAELLTGILAAAGIIYFFAAGSTLLIFYASIIGTASVTALFFGQRVAKDYAGAAVLVPYFILLITMMYLTTPNAK